MTETICPHWGKKIEYLEPLKQGDYFFNAIMGIPVRVSRFLPEKTILVSSDLIGQPVENIFNFRKQQELKP